MSDSSGSDGPRAAGSSISALYKNVSNLFAIPEGGTALRPLVRSLRLAISGGVSDVTNKTEREVTALAQNIKEKVDSTGEKLSSEVAPLVSDMTAVTSANNPLRDAEVRPGLKLGASLAALALVSYKFGPRVLLRNSLLGGGCATAYFFPDTPQKAWNELSTRAHSLYDEYAPKV